MKAMSANHAPAGPMRLVTVSSPPAMLNAGSAAL
jgi:hypothetical protein